jgi:toxin ParE1/3/4
MRRLRITPAAENDLDGIWAYIAKDNPSAADRFLRRLNDRMAGLPRYPEIGERQDRYRAGLRSIVEGSYVIFYEVTKDAVRIFRVLHGARDLDAIFGTHEEP